MMSLYASLSRSHCASTAFEGGFFSFHCVHTATQKRRCSVYHALLALLLRSLAFIPRFHGLSSALSVIPRKVKQWLLYNSKRYCNLKLDVDDYLKSSINFANNPRPIEDVYVEGIHDILT